MNSKINRIPEIMVTIVTVIGALVLAIYLGSSIGSGSNKIPMVIVGVMVISFIGFLMKEKIWILIFFCGGLPGRLMFLPLSITARDAGILLAFGWFLVWMVFKRIRVKPKYGLIDVVLLINFIYIALLFVRNPVGTLILDTDRVGGRPYFNHIIAACSYFVLARAVLTVRMAQLLPLISLAGVVAQAFIGALNFFIPATVPMMARLYGGLTLDNYSQSGDTSTGGDDGGGLSRLGFLKTLGERGIMLMVAFFSPLSMFSFARLKWGLLTLFFLWCILASGFRSALVGVAVTVILACLYHRRVLDAVMMMGMGVIFILFLVVGQGKIFDLPLGIQRTLTFLPGDWNIEAVNSADASKKWRFEMWEVMLTTDRYLKNRWFGDGFGYDRRDFREVAELKLTDPTLEQELFLVTGEVHSGPVSAIRFAGYVGLALYLWLACLLALCWHRLIRRTYRTPFFASALFYGISFVTAPFFFVFIFGGYESAVAGAAPAIGILHLVRSGFEKYLADEEAAKKVANILPDKLRSDEELPQRLLPT